MICFRACAFCLWLWVQGTDAGNANGLVERLRQTRAVNIGAIVEKQFGIVDPGNGFKVADPYGSGTGDSTRQWQLTANHESQLCALRFSSPDKMDYELMDFESSAAAAAAGFTLTHHGRCGSCSTLQDLAAYLATPDLTTPARQCARRFGLARKKKCFEEKIGFTAYCSESWAYNARHTKKACLGTCVADYGLLNLLFHRYPGENVDETGQLRPCLQCDEEQSGPGFKYSAGRTRRNSGIESAIPRPESEIYPVDHSAYFR
ncbi:MAG: hypothetical protein WBN06_04660 [Lysobacterales bacterium]